MSERSFSASSSVSEEGEEQQQRSQKRPRDLDTDEDLRRDSFDLRDSLLSKRQARPHDVRFRIVVPSGQIGKVIGKEGSQIRRIREETRATIKIADAVTRHEERVIIISSRDDENTISDAESALCHIARVILKEEDDGAETSIVSGGHVATNVIRLLIAGSQAGCLIGVSGQNIEQIRNSSGATISILPQNQLPPCASAHESDRLVQVSGDVPAILKALEKIGYTLRENPPKKVISIRPTYNISSTLPNSSYPEPSSAEHVTSEMMISEALVGGLIGKHGSNISQIRNESGATIKITGGKGERVQRQVYFGGTAQQVALAKSLVERYVYSQYLQQGSS